MIHADLEYLVQSLSLRDDRLAVVSKAEHLDIVQLPASTGKVFYGDSCLDLVESRPVRIHRRNQDQDRMREEMHIGKACADLIRNLNSA
jgi:hypothetical protein